jgi:hypothetical protein
VAVRIDLFDSLVNAQGWDVDEFVLDADFAEVTFQMDLEVLGSLEEGLISQELALILQDPMSVAKDPVFHLIFQPKERYSGNDVVYLAHIESLQCLEDVFRAVIHDLYPGVLEVLLQNALELRIALDHDQTGVGSHFAQHILSENTGACAVFDNNITTAEIDLVAYALHTKRRCGSYGSNIAIFHEVSDIEQGAHERQLL